MNPGSKAARGNIIEGDFITQVNNKPTSDLKNSDIHAIIKETDESLLLHLNEWVILLF